MALAALPIPGIAFGSYPEKRAPVANLFTGLVQSWFGSLSFGGRHLRARFARMLQDIDRAKQAGLSAHCVFRDKLAELSPQLAKDGLSDPLVAQSFALVEQAIALRMGYKVFDTQRYAAWVMLQNRLVEMATGEGKTLTASLAASTAALAGVPVHVITANDYLVQRDAQLLEPVYATLGLTVGFVTQSMNEGQRRAAYACDVTYCTAKELVFDYLRDGLARRAYASDLQVRAAQLSGAQRQQPVLRGLCMAIVDEADSILIDEARTPLILAQAVNAAALERFYRCAVELARSLEREVHFRIRAQDLRAELTDTARALLAQRALALGADWRDRRRREEAVSLALAALHAFKRDKHYLVRNDKVMLIDQTTGRVAPGRIFSRGIHQLLEVKEGCTVTGEQRTIAQITYQRFFPRYHRLCGMSGTLSEARSELQSVYRVPISTVPLRRPSQREYLPMRLYVSTQSKWRAVTERVLEMNRLGRPVLIGTDSVSDSDSLAQRLTAAGLQPQVLNARQDADEASIVALAGQKGAVTVATNMAGRGTDITLGPGVAELGGLHVICCQRNASRRIDRQLQGRCARQGDPGSVETILAWDEGLPKKYLGWTARFLLRQDGRSPLGVLGGVGIAVSQRFEEVRQQIERWRLLRQDALLEQRLSFAGRG